MDSQRAWTCFADARGPISAWLSLTPRNLLCPAQQLPSSRSIGRRIEERLLQRSLVLGMQALARRFDEAMDGLVRDAQHVCNLQQQ